MKLEDLTNAHVAQKHSNEFKQETVRIALTGGLTRQQVAVELGIEFLTPSKWMQISRTAETISVPD